MWPFLDDSELHTNLYAFEVRHRLLTELDWISDRNVNREKLPIFTIKFLHLRLGFCQLSRFLCFVERDLQLTAQDFSDCFNLRVSDLLQVCVVFENVDVFESAL